MNPLNYASLEASKRLVDAGIVLKTEKVWAFNAWPSTTSTGTFCWIEEFRLIDKPLFPYKEQYPAPSMAEVWRELPQSSCDKWTDGTAHCWTILGPDSPVVNTNPTDALIDLLVWVRKEKL